MPGVVAALAAEARILELAQRRRSRSPTASPALMIAVSGPGADAAAGSAASLLARGAQALVSFGVAGALDPVLAPGELILPEEIVRTDGRRVPLDPEWRAALLRGLQGSGIVILGGALAELAQVATTAGAKAAAARHTGAVAADMESGAVAVAALGAGVPCLCVRAIADTADTSIPGCALAAMGAHGRVHPLRALRALLRRPWELAALLRLASAFASARDTLSAVADALEPPPRA